MISTGVINNIKLHIIGGRDIPLQFKELKNDEYELDQMNFDEGDVVVDIGANVGMVSCYLAKKFPFIKILSFEPNPITYDLLLRNIQLNDIHNIKPNNIGVSANSEPIIIYYEPDFLGSASSFVPSMVREKNFREIVCMTKTLDMIFEEENIDHCKLLKIDCEGAEFSCLFATSVLPKIEHIKAEFHLNNKLRLDGYSYDTLAQHCREQIKGTLVFVENEIPD